MNCVLVTDADPIALDGILERPKILRQSELERWGTAVIEEAIPGSASKMLRYLGRAITLASVKVPNCNPYLSTRVLLD